MGKIDLVRRDRNGASHVAIGCVRFSARVRAGCFLRIPDRDIDGIIISRRRGVRRRCTDHRKEDFNVLHGFLLFAFVRSAICVSQSLASCRGRIQIEAEFIVKRSIKLLDVIARDDGVIKKDKDAARSEVRRYVLEMSDVRLVRSRG
jgi:hypothetical protein